MGFFGSRAIVEVVSQKPNSFFVSENLELTFWRGEKRARRGRGGRRGRRRRRRRSQTKVCFCLKFMGVLDS